MTPIPLDIFCYLFSFLFHIRDIHSLRACVLVHSTWHDLCRTFLLRNSICYAPVVDNIINLQHNPSIGNYVRTLTLTGGHMHRDTPAPFSPYEQLGTRALYSSDVMALVSHMKKLTTLYIGGFQWHDMKTDIYPVSGLKEITVSDIVCRTYPGDLMKLLQLADTWESVTLRRIFWYSFDRKPRVEKVIRHLAISFPCRGPFAAAFASHLPIITDLSVLEFERIRAGDIKYLQIMTLDPLLAFLGGPSTSPSQCLRKIMLQLPPNLRKFELQIRISNSPARRFRRHLGFVDWKQFVGALERLKELVQVTFSLYPSHSTTTDDCTWNDEYLKPVMQGLGGRWITTGKLLILVTVRLI
ncbi:hypothetical protein EIP86_008279 [Pleurotus ostreatoroseus]|nr:hypothetical protein EIP86_008279 [Pleurotus ostreatoroseus]